VVNSKLRPNVGMRREQWLCWHRRMHRPVEAAAYSGTMALSRRNSDVG